MLDPAADIKMAGDPSGLHEKRVKTSWWLEVGLEIVLYGLKIGGSITHNTLMISVDNL